jgi:hypothetical protein
MSITNANLVDPFFEETEFTETATYTPSGGQPSSIRVIFDRENSITPIGNVAIDNAAPQALAKTSDVAGVNNKATLVIGGVTYYVKDVQPSAHGLTTLILSKYDK